MDLTNFRELKKNARALSYHQLQSAVDTLQGVLNERQKEVEVIASIRDFASSKGFSLEQLGYTLINSSASNAEDSKSSSGLKNTRPAKPKLLSINADKQLFYFKDGELTRLSSHTLKPNLLRAGVQLLKFSELDKKQQKMAKSILEKARKASVDAYNRNVDTWNEWAQANNEEILAHKILF